MENKNIHRLRESIYSKFSQIESKKDPEVRISYDIEDINEDILKKDFTYITNSKNISILYVDNEIPNLKNFQNSFNADYQIFLAHSIELALDILNKEKIDIVMLEQKSNTNVCIDFLSNIRNKIAKSPIFMIMSSKTDTNILINTSNDTNIFKFVVNSSDLENIKNSISEAYYYHLNK